jgi:exopolysaccharide biosynthesis polyprenyl glycosylphosphotransferase
MYGGIARERLRPKSSFFLHYIKAISLKEALYLFFKRFFDILLSIIALTLCIPIFIAIALAIKLDSKGPVFFIHKRIGKNRKPINIYKFRTMVDHADKMIQNFTPEQQKEYQRNFKLDKDPRITKIGKFLRASSLDELPQLINILFGDISIVGPRPVVKKELKKYGQNVERLLSVKPGLTGYWQIHGRSNTTYQQRVEMDMKYIRNRSLWMDFKIILHTVPAVLKRNGAY